MPTKERQEYMLTKLNYAVITWWFAENIGALYIYIATDDLQLLYVGLLHAGVFNSAYGPGYRRDGSAHGGGIALGHEPQTIDIPETWNF